jgi:hypothetical protein
VATWANSSTLGGGDVGARARSRDQPGVPLGAHDDVAVQHDHVGRREALEGGVEVVHHAAVDRLAVVEHLPAHPLLHGGQLLHGELARPGVIEDHDGGLGARVLEEADDAALPGQSAREEGEGGDDVTASDGSAEEGVGIGQDVDEIIPSSVRSRYSTTSVALP